MHVLKLTYSVEPAFRVRYWKFITKHAQYQEIKNWYRCKDTKWFLFMLDNYIAKTIEEMSKIRINLYPFNCKKDSSINWNVFVVVVCYNISMLLKFVAYWLYYLQITSHFRKSPRYNGSIENKDIIIKHKNKEKATKKEKNSIEFFFLT